MDLFIVSLRENFWSPGKHESERWSGVFIWFNTLWLLPISKSEYFNEKIQFNSRADWILANLSYIYIDSSYRWKIKRTIIYGTWSMHLNQYAISLSFQRHLSPYINHPVIISLINFYIHSSFNSQTPLISPDKTRKSVFIPFLYKFISFFYRSINHPHNNNFSLLTIPIQQNSLQKIRAKNKSRWVSPEFSIRLFISSLLKKGGWITLAIPFPFPETRIPFPASFVPPINYHTLLSSFPFRNRSGLKGGSVQSGREISHCSISERTCVQHCAAPLNYPRLTKGRGSPPDR